MNNDLQLLDEALNILQEGFVSFSEPIEDSQRDQIASVLNEVALAMQNNYPYMQANYAGQMLKPPHVIARLAYMLALYINPNNHALDGSRASSPMEMDCIRKLGTMIGWENALGHLTSGGTMANLEALWVARQYHPEKYVVASNMAHYTHERISAVLGIPFTTVAADNSGRMDISDLCDILKTYDVGTVVVTLGTTGMGAVDPLEAVLKLQKQFNFRIHVDSAYGGYFILADNLETYCKTQFEQLIHVDSFVIDPHKHGLQPYGCGCILFRDPKVGQFYKHDSPYTYFTSEALHLGEISLECSRPGASAVALWATMKFLPLERGGAFSKMLASCHRAAFDLYRRLDHHARFIPISTPDLDIVVWAVQGDSVREMSERASVIFQRLAKENIHLALIKIQSRQMPEELRHMVEENNTVTCLRSCLMKPEHEGYIDVLWSHIVRLTDEICD